MPVLPPTDESTCASSVVGTCTKSTPRRTADAAKPARSPITPPPSATRGRSLDPRRDQFFADPLEHRIAFGGFAGRHEITLLSLCRLPSKYASAAADEAAATCSSVTIATAAPARKAAIRRPSVAIRPRADDDVIGAAGRAPRSRLSARRNATEPSWRRLCLTSPEVGEQGRDRFIHDHVMQHVARSMVRSASA